MQMELLSETCCYINMNKILEILIAMYGALCGCEPLVNVHFKSSNRALESEKRTEI